MNPEDGAVVYLSNFLHANLLFTKKTLKKTAKSPSKVVSFLLVLNYLLNSLLCSST